MIKKIMDSNDLTIQIVSQLAEMNANMKTVLERLTNHENRLLQLEQEKPSLKSDVVALLVKALIIALITIGSLTGAAGLIQRIFIS